MKAARVHARTPQHRRAIDGARYDVDRALDGVERPSMSVSGGKDSTLMMHFVAVTMGRRDVVAVSEKDDLDYPGEEAYLRSLAYEWGVTLRIVRPAVSVSEWIRTHAATREHRVTDDIHARTAGLSKACFYGVIERANADYDLVMLGLRAEEGRVRSTLRSVRGAVYTLKSGQRRANPFIDWTGLDLYAYALAHDIPLLPLYRCIAFMHAHAPWKVRKSWWLPAGATSRYGTVAWLRHYFPSLYDLLLSWMPDARTYR